MTHEPPILTFLAGAGQPLTTRFAPSPTGYLHIGHAAAALYVWGLGRALGAQILLRIEDHDRGRSRTEFEKAIVEDLEWLGFDADEPHVRQSDREAVYQKALESLATRAHVYGCDCTRKRIGELKGGEGELRYDGHCRNRGLPVDDKSVGVRVKLPDESVSFTDGNLGPQTQRPQEQGGDSLLRDRHGNWTYQHAAVVDDFVQGVSLVVRGQDLTASTGRQILLGRLLGRRTPAAFYHHPLIVDATGKKLSKRFYAEAVAKRREAGESAASVLGEAAHLVGLQPSPAPLDTSAALALVAKSLKGPRTST